MQIDTYTMGVWGKREFAGMPNPREGFYGVEAGNRFQHCEYRIYRYEDGYFAHIRMGRWAGERDPWLNEGVFIPNLPSLLMFMKEYSHPFSAPSTGSIAYSLYKVAEHLSAIKSSIEEYMDR